MSSSTNSSDSGVDVALLEKRLEGLRDTQESVQGLSIWCQANKKYSTAIIESWLKCLKKSPVEKRLTLFYLANDVVQHAKRKGDSTLINQWAVAVQKATPHVRSPSSISSAIARIFKIWEERNVYSRDAVSDLLALLNTASGKEKKEKRPAAKKPETYTASAEKVQKFDPSTMISKIKVAFKLKSHLGNTFRTKHYFNMKMDQLIGSIKDRQHGMEVVQELAQLLEECKSSEHKLQTEVEERRKLVEIAEIGIVSYENVRGEAGIVNTAYKNFTNRIESTKEKVDEKLKAFQAMESPEPSFPGSDFVASSMGFMQRQSTNTNFDALNSISLPPHPPPKSTEKGPPSQFSDYSAGDQGRRESDSFQQSLYNPTMPLSSMSAGYDISAPPWTNDTYTSMMSMMQMQYQPPPQPQPPPPQEPATSVPPGPGSGGAPVFSLTPSMQLQMQMQQQQVAAMHQQFQPPQAYGAGGGGVNNNFHSPQSGPIPLPPSENPPLPPEPNHSLSLSQSMTNNSGQPPDLYSHPSMPLPSDYATPSSGHQPKQHDSSFDSSEMESPSSSSYGGAQQSQYQCSNSQDSYSSRNNGGTNAHPPLGPGPSLTSTPRNPQFSHAGPGPRFPHQRSNSSSGFNGYGSGSGDTEFDSEGNMPLNGDEAGIGGGGGSGMYDNSPEFYDQNQSYGGGGMGMDSQGPRMPLLSPHKPPRMFQPNWRGGGGRGRPTRPPFPYDGGFRGGPPRGMRGGFVRGGRRGFR